MSQLPILDDAVSRLMGLDQESAMALADIAQERVRQIEAEGWTPSHDDQHTDRQMARAAACYAIGGAMMFWPWSEKWWKPKSPHRNAVRAGALLIAELARMARKAPRP